MSCKLKIKQAFRRQDHKTETKKQYNKILMMKFLGVGLENQSV